MCTIDLKHCCDETPGEQVRNYYRQQGYANGFQAGYDAGNEGMMKAVATAELLERKRIIKLLEGKGVVGVDAIIALIKGENQTDETTTCYSCQQEPKHCNCNNTEDERTGN